MKGTIEMSNPTSDTIFAFKVFFNNNSDQMY
jgi:hypothetical protein